MHIITETATENAFNLNNACKTMLSFVGSNLIAPKSVGAKSVVVEFRIEIEVEISICGNLNFGEVRGGHYATPKMCIALLCLLMESSLYVNERINFNVSLNIILYVN